MKRMRRVNRETVLQQMMELAAGAANDAVKLAYLTGEDREQISELDLGALTEFKRSSNGTVEVKLADSRIARFLSTIQNLDEVIAATGIPSGQFLRQLTMLELKGVIRRLPGKQICLKQ